MPLFRDPDRRRYYPQSPDDDEQPATGPSPLQVNEPRRRESRAPEMSASPMESTRSHMATSRANDREELIHRIKESSPWRFQHTVCESSEKLLGAVIHFPFALLAEGVRK
jgi:hypothetical protein